MITTTHLAPISLAELDAAASLQTRVDRKYLVPTEALPAVVAALDPATRVLEIGGQRGFGYESVYFDTPSLTSYLGAARRRRNRFKVRTRTYLDSDRCWVEVKTRGPRGATVKTRQEHEATGRTELDDPAQEFTTELLGALDGPMSPTLVSTYDRLTLHVPAVQQGRPDSRTTIDTNLVWTDADTGSERVLAGLAVVETKTGSTPSSTDRALWRLGHRPVRISKYGTGMAVLHPELPATPWRRVLDRHVAAATS